MRAANPERKTGNPWFASCMNAVSSAQKREREETARFVAKLLERTGGKRCGSCQFCRGMGPCLLQPSIAIWREDAIACDQYVERLD